jgi:hypothetical protein
MTDRQLVVNAIRTLLERNDPLQISGYVNVEDVADFFDPTLNEQEIGDTLAALVTEGILQFGDQEDVAFTIAYLNTPRDCDDGPTR